MLSSAEATPHRDSKPVNVILEAAAVGAGCALVVVGACVVGALSVTAHLVARVVPPRPARVYVPVELRVMLNAGRRRR